jgi:predicted cobalt transporter CbtA
MKKRPLTISILSFVFLATGAIGFAYHLTDFKAQQPFQYELVWISAVRLTAIVCGVFMLRGSNWARWLALAWIAFHVVVSFFHSLQEVVAHSLLFMLIAYFLFSSEARAYFRHREQMGV